MIGNQILIAALESVGAAIATLLVEIVQSSIQIYFAQQFIIRNIDVKEYLKVFAYVLLSLIVICIFKKSDKL